MKVRKGRLLCGAHLRPPPSLGAGNIDRIQIQGFRGFQGRVEGGLGAFKNPGIFRKKHRHFYPPSSIYPFPSSFIHFHNFLSFLCSSWSERLVALKGREEVQTYDKVLSWISPSKFTVSQK